MTKSMRAAIAAAVGLLAFVFAGSGLSALNPRLTIGATTQKGNSTTSIQARVGVTDDAVGRLQVFVPAGFSLVSPPGGMQVGTMSATALGTQIGPDDAFKMTGSVAAIAVDDPAVAFENAHCDAVPHAGAWLARVQGGGDAWSFPIFVDRTTGAERSFGQLKLVACFKSVEGQNMDQLGNKFVSMSLRVKALSAPQRPGAYRWRSLWTPFDANGSLSQAGTVEAQSIARMPVGVLAIAGRMYHEPERPLVRIVGRVFVDGEALDGAIVAIRHGQTRAGLAPVGAVRTAGDGRFLKVVNLLRPQFFQAGTTIGGEDLGASGCTPSFGPAIACLDATNAKVAIVSRIVRFAA